MASGMELLLKSFGVDVAEVTKQAHQFQAIAISIDKRLELILAQNRAIMAALKITTELESGNGEGKGEGERGRSDVGAESGRAF